MLTTGHLRCKREGEEGEKVSVSECRLAVLPELSDLLSPLLLLLLSVVSFPGRVSHPSPQIITQYFSRRAAPANFQHLK